MLLIESPCAKKREISDLMRRRFWAGQGATPLAFFCECDDAGCYRPVWLTLAAYDAARIDPRWVAFAEGHPVGTIGQAAGEQSWAIGDCRADDTDTRAAAATLLPHALPVGARAEAAARDLHTLRLRRR